MSRSTASSPAPEATRQDWLAAVERSLQGAGLPPLRSRALADLRLDHLDERARDAVALAGRAPGAAWRVVQRVDHPGPSEANRLALDDLEGGADGLALVGADAPAARGFGLRLEGDGILDAALAGVRLDLVGIRLEAGSSIVDAAARLDRLARAGGHDPALLDLVCAADPLTTDAGDLGRLLRLGWRGPLLCGDGRPAHEAGATAAQEVAAAAAAGLAALRRLEAAGLSLDAARRHVGFTLAADCEIIPTLAKMRAFRLVWARIEEVCGLAPAIASLHAETSWRMMTRRDPPTNMIRATIAAFAAAAGGAGSLLVLPFTAALGLPDARARRIARNLQHILIAEANLHRVADPAAGSGSVEAATDAICREAWRLIQAIEAGGGLAACLASGWLEAEIARAEAAPPPPRIVGTTDYPDPAADAADVLAPVPPALPASGPLASRRAAEPFEAAP